MGTGIFCTAFVQMACWQKMTTARHYRFVSPGRDNELLTFKVCNGKYLLNIDAQRIKHYIDGLVHDCSNSIAKALELLQSKPSIWCQSCKYHYNDIIMTTMASQITSLAVVYSAVYSGVDQRKYQSPASMAFVWRIHRDRWIPRTKFQ